jgi:predicted kinase
MCKEVEMKTVIILRGVSGSGKSTVASLLETTKHSCYVCSADKYFMRGGEYKFEPSRLKDAHSWCFEMFDRCVLNAIELIVVDNTNTSEWEYEKYETHAKRYGYTVHRLVVEACGQDSIHGVPPEVIVKQRERLANSISL